MTDCRESCQYPNWSSGVFLLWYIFSTKYHGSTGFWEAVCWQKFPPSPHIRAGRSWWPVTDLSDLVVSQKIWTAAWTPEFPAWVGSSLYTGISRCTHGNKGGGKCDTSDGQKVATGWLDLLLCLTFSLANQWLGDINRPCKAPSQKCCVSFRHQYVHFHNLTKGSYKLTISRKSTRFVRSIDWIGGRLGLKCVLWGMPVPLLYLLLPTDLPRASPSSSAWAIMPVVHHPPRVISLLRGHLSVNSQL